MKYAANAISLGARRLPHETPLAGVTEAGA
jgi:hypothetical protein